MPFQPGTGELILRAAQGLTQTLQLQAQLVQRQKEREDAHALEMEKLRAKNDVDSLQHQKDLLDLQLKAQQVAAGQRAATPEAIAAEEKAQAALTEQREAAAAESRARAALLGAGPNVSQGTWNRMVDKAGGKILERRIAEGATFTYTDATGAPVTAEMSKFTDRISTLVGQGTTASSLETDIRRLTERTDKLRREDFRFNTTESKNRVAASEQELNQLLQNKSLVLEIARARGEGISALQKQDILSTAESEEEREAMSRALDLRDPLSVVATTINIPVDYLQRHTEDLVMIMKGRVTREQFNDPAFKIAMDRILRLTAGPNETEETLQRRAREFAEAVLR